MQKTRNLAMVDVFRAIGQEFWREVCAFPAYLRQAFREQPGSIIVLYLACTAATIVLTVGQI